MKCYRTFSKKIIVYHRGGRYKGCIDLFVHKDESFIEGEIYKDNLDMVNCSYAEIFLNIIPDYRYLGSKNLIPYSFNEEVDGINFVRGLLEQGWEIIYSEE